MIFFTILGLVIATILILVLLFVVILVSIKIIGYLHFQIEKYGLSSKHPKTLKRFVLKYIIFVLWMRNRHRMSQREAASFVGWYRDSRLGRRRRNWHGFRRLKPQHG